MRLAAALAATVLALAPAAFAPSAWAQDIKVTVQGRDSIVLTPADFAALPRAKATMVEGGKSAVYEGVLLNAALVQAGVVHGDRLMGRYLNQVVIVKAVDGYVSILSLAETDPFYRDNPVVIADRKNGQPLDAREGPYRVVVDGDRKPSRSARQVNAIEVRPAY